MAESQRDFYEVLGVERDADAKTIKRAFLKKARVLHPDVSDDPDAEAKFKELNEAYSVLSDETKRANYDRYGTADGPAGFGGMDDFFGGGFDMSDLFSQFFGGGAAGAGRVRTRGRDMSVTLTITLQEAATGLDRTITYDRLAPCEDCGGTGSADGSAPIACPECGGTGVVTSWQHTILGRMQTQSTCPECHGTGQVIEHPCETCDGQGRTPSHEKVTVHIPAGVSSGMQLSIEGAGEAGVRGDRAGDLIVRIEVAQQPDLVRQGDDLICAVGIDCFEAMLGATFTMEGIMPHEQVEVNIPAGTQPGDHVRVPGYGMPNLYNPSQRGSLVCIVNLTVPKDLTPAQTQQLEAVALERGSRLSTSDTAQSLLDETFAQDRQAAGASTAPAAEKPRPSHQADSEPSSFFGDEEQGSLFGGDGASGRKKPRKKPRPKPFGKRKKKRS